MNSGIINSECIATIHLPKSLFGRKNFSVSIALIVCVPV